MTTPSRRPETGPGQQGVELGNQEDMLQRNSARAGPVQRRPFRLDRRGAAVTAEPTYDSAAVIQVSGLTKSYGDVHAVAGIDLQIARGEVFAMLGPNGAGKTTTVEILEGYRRRDGGEVKVLGLDPGTQRGRLKTRIGIVLQSTGVDRYLTVAETISMYSGYYPHPRRRQALGRPAAPPGRRDRAGGRPRAAVPGRADDRVRPVRPP